LAARGGPGIVALVFGTPITNVLNATPLGSGAGPVLAVVVVVFVVAIIIYNLFKVAVALCPANTITIYQVTFKRPTLSVLIAYPFG